MNNSELGAKIHSKRTELQRREQSCGTYHDVGKMNRLRREIAQLEQRLEKVKQTEPQIYPCCDNPDCDLCFGSGIHDPRLRSGA